MAVKPIFTPETEQDVASAYQWYEARRTGLGEDFLSRLDACVQALCRNPEIYEAVHKNYRRALLRRFPYVIYFSAAEELITIYGVMHTSRDPAESMRRLV